MLTYPIRYVLASYFPYIYFRILGFENVLSNGVH